MDVSRIKELAKSQGKSVAYICALMGQQRGYLNDVQNKNLSIPEDRLSAVALDLNTTVDYLLGNSDLKEKPTTDTGDELSILDKQLIDAMQGLSDDQKRFLLAQIEVTLKQEQ